MATIADRIKEAMTRRGIKQSDLVSMTGIGKSSISTYLSGEYEPKQRNIYKLAKALDVNEAWLMGENVIMDRIDMDALLDAASKSAFEDSAFLEKHSGLVLANDSSFNIGCIIHCHNSKEMLSVHDILLRIAQLSNSEQTNKLSAITQILDNIQHMPYEKCNELLNYSTFLREK